MVDYLNGIIFADYLESVIFGFFLQCLVLVPSIVNDADHMNAGFIFIDSIVDKEFFSGEFSDFS